MVWHVSCLLFKIIKVCDSRIPLNLNIAKLICILCTIILSQKSEMPLEVLWSYVGEELACNGVSPRNKLN